MWADINTKVLQGSLFYKIRGHLMGIDEDYDGGFERLNTHQNLLPSQECAYRVSDKDASVLAAIVKVLKVSQNYFRMPPIKIKLPWHICYSLERWHDKIDSHHPIAVVCWETRLNPYDQGIRARARTNVYACTGKRHVD